MESVNPAIIPSLCDGLGRQADFRKAFPMIGHASFQRSVLAANEIQDGEGAKGFLFEIKPSPEFHAYGDRESLLMMYPEYQRRGIGTLVISRISKMGVRRFFVSAKSNLASTSFFHKQPMLKLVDENERCRVYAPSNKR
jgi:hypothetical protein